MTYEDLKRELTIMRERQLVIEELRQKLRDTDERKFDRMVNVTDPSRERITRSRSTDDRIINAIDKAERKEEYILRKLEGLPPENKEIEDAIIKMTGRPAWALFDYYVIGKSFECIAREMDVGTGSVKTYLKNGMNELWQRLQTV